MRNKSSMPTTVERPINFIFFLIRKYYANRKKLQD